MSTDTQAFETTPRPEFGPPPQEVLQWGQVIFQHFDMDVDPYARPQEYREALEHLDPRYKKDQHLLRYELEQDSRQWPEPTKRLIDMVAAQMGMNNEITPETPLPTEDTELYLGLGGARKANLDRTLYATDGMAARHSRGVFLGTGSARKLEQAEREKYVVSYAPDLSEGATETDLLDAAARHAKAFHPELDIDVVPAPAGKIGTVDVIKRGIDYYTDHNGGNRPASFTAVTQQIYRLYTLMDARRAALERGIDRFYVAGCPSEQAIVDSRTHATYLSEIMRTLRAALDCYEFEAGAASSVQ